MKELLILKAAASTKEQLIDDFKEAITEWEINKTENNFDMLVFHAHLLMLRKLTKGDMSEAFKVMKDMDKFDRLTSVFENKN